MPKDPSERTRRPGRLRSALQVLLGQRLTPEQIQAEWLEYQVIFNDILTRWSASLARQAKVEKERATALAQAAPETEAPVSSKAELRSRAADRMGLGALRRRIRPAPPTEHANGGG